MAADSQEGQLPFNGLDEIRTYIEQNTAQPLNREQLATMAGFSVPHFHRIFSAEIGENIAAYIRRIRLERAARKLFMGAVDITQVAHAAGYQTHAAFSKAFKQHYGYTPSEFRALDFETTLATLHQGKSHDKN